MAVRTAMESFQVEAPAVEDPRPARAAPRLWTPIKIAVAVLLVGVSLSLSALLIHYFVAQSSSGGAPSPPRSPDDDEICQDLPYSSIPVPTSKVGIAEAVTDWEGCPMLLGCC